MSQDATYLDEIRTIVQEHLQDEPVRVFLFGSFARGDQRRSSDVDVAVLPDGEVSPTTLTRLREALHESTVPYVVEVVDLSTVQDSLRERVLEEGEEWDV